MIENLVVNGCSFTHASPGVGCWSEYVAKEMNISHYYNLAMGGAGNWYICSSTIEFLESSNLSPVDTLVLIMWSGISRKDILISEEQATHIQKSYNWVLQHNNQAKICEDRSYYLLSGGEVGSWVDAKSVSPIFHSIYRLADKDTLCKESLLDFINLANYLKVNGYNYRFTNFINLWDTSPRILDHGEHTINTEKYSLATNFDFSNWIFIDEFKNGFGEFAAKRNAVMDNHPTKDAHHDFAYEIMLPSILKDFA